MRTKRSGEAALLLLDVIDILDANTVDYVVIGAMAVSVHGAVRASVDADAMLKMATQELRDLQKRFDVAKFTTSLRFGDVDDPVGAMLVVSDGFGNRVDLLVGLRGLEPEAFARAIVVQFQEQAMKIIGREDLIAMKIFAGGPQDMVDARNVIASAGGALNLTLLRRLARRYGNQTVAALEPLISEYDLGST